MKVRRFVVTMLILVVSATTHSKVTVLCKAYYNSKFGWGDGAITEVTFYTGDELNKATDSYSYTGSVYATIWFSQSNVAIVKINTYGYHTRGFSRSDLEDLFRYNYTGYISGEQVNSEKKRSWRIEAKETTGFYQKWIDPRLN